MNSMNMNSLYSLTWGDYSASLVNSIQLLRCHNDLVDCTLAAGGRVFPAHKIVLCAASPLLLDLLKNTPCKHPVVMLAGVNPTDLEALLEFVYRGEVSVDHSQLPSLLQAAHCLNIQGLAPQTISKEDYANTQYQLPLMQHSETELITTLNTPQHAQQQQQQQVHTQIVESISADHNMTTTNSTSQPQQQHQQNSMKGEIKDSMNQFLPARKRKPRNKSKSPIFLSETSPKMSRTDGMESIISSPTTPQPLDNSQLSHHTINTGSAENGDGMNSIKSEIGLPENAITLDDISTPTTQNTTSTPIKSGRQSRQRSQSEQPATCPICYAVIRQSRNLRRHLELRHFAKPGVKKERKAGGKKLNLDTSGSSTGGQTNVSAVGSSNAGVPQVQTVQTLHPMQTVQVKKDPDGSINPVGCSGTTSSTVTPVTVVTSTHPQHTQHVQQPQHHHQGQQQAGTAIVDQSGHVIATTQGQQILTQNENADGTLSIAQVQTLQGHPLTLGNLNQVNMTEYQQHQHH
ncbi:Trl family protein [Megaselia abdita]